MRRNRKQETRETQRVRGKDRPLTAAQGQRDTDRVERLRAPHRRPCSRETLGSLTPFRRLRNALGDLGDPPRDT